MNKLYQKNELAFALVWIAIYVAGTSLAEALSETLGVYKLVSAVFHVVLAAGLFLWVRRNGLAEKYGLFLPRYRLSQALFFIPLALVCLYKLVFSPSLRFSVAETIPFVVSMLCVGFLEELIFRGFLFRAIEKENLIRAIIISSVTFGIGHIVNLDQYYCLHHDRGRCGRPGRLFRLELETPGWIKRALRFNACSDILTAFRLNAAGIKEQANETGNQKDSGKRTGNGGNTISLDDG